MDQSKKYHYIKLGLSSTSTDSSEDDAPPTNEATNAQQMAKLVTSGLKLTNLKVIPSTSKNMTSHYKWSEPHNSKPADGKTELVKFYPFELQDPVRAMNNSVSILPKTYKKKIHRQQIWSTNFISLVENRLLASSSTDIYEKLNEETKRKHKEETKPLLHELIEASCICVFDKHPMSDAQKNQLYYSLCRGIEDMCVLGTGPRFLKFDIEDSWNVIVSENASSKEWVKKTVMKLRPWPNASLYTLDGSLLPNLALGIAFIPKHTATCFDSAMKLMRVQNQGLNTECWKVICVKDEENGFIFQFTIDYVSAEVLRCLNGYVTLGFEEIHIKVKQY